MVNTTDRVKTIIPHLEGMTRKELLTVISLANGLIKTNMSKTNSKSVDGLVNTIIESLITAGIGIARDELEKLIHPHKKAIAHAAVPVTEEDASALCPPGYIRNSAGECKPDIG